MKKTSSQCLLFHQRVLPLFVMALVFVLAGNAAAQEGEDAAPVQNKQPSPADSQPSTDQVPGIAIGESLPEISLGNQDGKTVSLQELAKRGPVALVFYRSASW